jgi:hypothetical protein
MTVLMISDAKCQERNDGELSMLLDEDHVMTRYSSRRRTSIMSRRQEQR